MRIVKFVVLTGEYLALTGEKLHGVEMIACRLATHYSMTEVSSFCALLLYRVPFWVSFLMYVINFFNVTSLTETSPD